MICFGINPVLFWYCYVLIGSKIFTWQFLRCFFVLFIYIYCYSATRIWFLFIHVSFLQKLANAKITCIENLTRKVHFYLSVNIFMYQIVKDTCTFAQSCWLLLIRSEKMWNLSHSKVRSELHFLKHVWIFRNLRRRKFHPFKIGHLGRLRPRLDCSTWTTCYLQVDWPEIYWTITTF